MQKFIIEGGTPLRGEVTISGSKNAALPIIAATTLINGITTLHNVPLLGDIRTMLKILENVNIKTKISSNTLTIDASAVNNNFIPYELVSTMRASFLMAGALLGRLKEVKIAHPGGCAIGARPVGEHLHGFKALGVEIKEEHGYINATCKSSPSSGTKVTFNERSVTATENIILASVFAEGEVSIINGAFEPHIIDLINFLNAAGAKIHTKDGIIFVQGVKDLHPIEYTITPDYIEAGTFMICAGITAGDVFLRNACWEDSTPEISKLQEIGVEITKEKNGIRAKGKYPFKSSLIKTAPYPGFPTDLQSQITSLLTLAQGASIVIETMYEKRFNHIPELIRMGAQIEIKDRSAIINGVKELSGTKVMASDIRGGAALVIAGLAAKDTTEVLRVYHIDRGYEKIESKLQGLGAKIKRV
ncbi:MAG: UDP-N-acetylglucosamine 1-carboxyvinyltransferase [bacterium]